MKRKFAGIAALGMALTLAFGLTVSAAESPKTESGVTQTALNESAETYKSEGDVSVEAVSLDVQQNVENALKDNWIQEIIAAKLDSIKKKGCDKPLPTVELTVTGELQAKLEKDQKVDVPITSTLVKDGKNYLILHIKADGTPEVLGPFKASGNTVTATFTSLSPISLIPVGEENAEAADSHWGEKDPVPATQAAPAGAATSPQTGEVLPIVGFMAVICLAGAVVCVRKAHN